MIRARLTLLRDKLIFKLPAPVVQHPFEILIAVLCVISGAGLLLTGPTATPSTIDDLLPLWLVTVWSATLLGSGVFILLGKFFNQYHVERAGMALLAAGTLVYSLAIYVSPAGLFGSNHSGLLAATTYLFFGLAAAIRYGVIGLTISRIKESLR